jgi:hypothetical protein
MFIVRRKLSSRHFGQYLPGRGAGGDRRIRTTLAEVFRIELSAFHLHAWLAGPGFGSMVTYLVPVEEFPGPYAETTPPPL